MTFTYNFDTHTLESNDPSVFVKVAGKSPGQGTFFALYLGDKRIGFASNYHWRGERSEVREDGAVVWRITELGCALYARQAYIGGGMDEDIPMYRFADEAEQALVMDTIIKAVSAYPGIPDVSRYGEEPTFVEGDASPGVEFTEGLRLKVEKGALLKDATPFRYDRDTGAVCCDDPKVFMRYAGQSREQGAHFVLDMDGKRFGFASANYYEDDQTEKLPDGSTIWRIDAIGCRVFANESYGEPVGVERSKFADRAEQDRALDLFAKALMAYSGRRTFVTGDGIGSAEDQGMCLVEYTTRALKLAADGAYLRRL